MGLFSSKKTIPATGFYTMPKEYQDLYRGLLNQSASILLPNGQVNTEMFTPLAKTADETRAMEMMRQGFAPTQESLNRDVSMLMNPYDDYVIEGMNREAQGQNSILNQALSRTGQTGSNRSILGANDLEQQRLGQIGQFRQGQYNNAVNTALGTLTNLRQNDASNLMNIGSFDRNLDTMTRQAPFTALQAGQGSLNAFQTSGFDFGAPERTIKSSSGFGSMLGQIGGAALGSMVGMPQLGAAIGGGLGGSLGGGGLSGGLSGAIGGYTGSLGKGVSGLMSSTGLSGGLDPSTGINWNSGRTGGGFSFFR
jgi:hypothetical protein